MAIKNIKGLTVEIGGDTTKLSDALKDVEKQGITLQQDLKQVNNLLKMDPGNVELVAEKQKILTEAIKNSEEKLTALMNASEQVKKQYENGEIDRGAYLKFQQEVQNTEKQLDSYQEELENTGKASKKTADEVEGSGDKWKKFGSVVKGAAEAAAAAVAAVSAAAVGAVKAVVDMANETAQLGDAIDKSSQKLGVSAEFYQEWDAVLQHSGTSMDAMGATFKKLATASQNASKDQQAAFEQLGLSMEQVQSMSAEELFTAVVSGLQGMEESTERTALATQLLGKGAQELGPLLNTSAEDTQAMIDEVNRLGGVMSNEAVKASATYQDTLQDLQTAIGGLKNNLIADVLPAITQIMDGLTALFTGDEGGLAMVSEGINSVVNMISEALPGILEMVTTLLTDLLQTIVDNLPSLIETVTDVLMNIIDTIVQMLPQILDAGVQMLLTLAEGIAEALPELIPTVVDVVLTLVDKLIENVPMLIEAALAIILGLAQGIIDSLPELLERIPEIITGIVGAIIESLPMIIEAGVELFVALTESIPKALPQIVGMIPEITMGIIDAFLSVDWLEVGAEIMSSIGEGLKTGVSNIGGAVKGAVSGIKERVSSFFGGNSDNSSSLVSAMPSASSYSAGSSYSGTASGGNSTTFIQNNYSPTALNRQQINRDTRNALLLANAR